jgi:hypothetical protein
MAERAAKSPIISVTIDRTERLGALAGRLSRTLGLARALALSGRTVDLRGIEDGVGMLCAQTLDLSAVESRQMRPVLLNLLAELDLLRLVLHGLPAAAPPPHSKHAAYQ